MQATIGTKRFDSGTLKVAVVGIGIVASVALGVIFTLVTDEAPARSVAGMTTDAPLSTELGSYTFEEQNMFLPDAGATALERQGINQAERMSRLNEHGVVAPAVQPAELTRFLEQNTELPGSSPETIAQVAARHGVTVAEWISFLDANRDTPAATTTPQRQHIIGLTEH